MHTTDERPSTNAARTIHSTVSNGSTAWIQAVRMPSNISNIVPASGGKILATARPASSQHDRADRAFVWGDVVMIQTLYDRAGLAHR